MLSEQNPEHYPKNLKWTGTQIEFVELLYAFHEANCFGNTSLKDLFCIMGQIVDCKVKNHYRLFWDIKNRTAEERTFFLNKLKKKLLDKLVRMDSGGWR